MCVLSRPSAPLRPRVTWRDIVPVCPAVPLVNRSLPWPIRSAYRAKPHATAETNGATTEQNAEALLARQCGTGQDKP